MLSNALEAHADETHVLKILCASKWWNNLPNLAGQCLSVYLFIAYLGQ